MKLPNFLRRDNPSSGVITEKQLNAEWNKIEKLGLPDLDVVLASIPPKPKPRGRVIKQTRHSEFNPNPIIKGGRVIKVMPRQLQKIKAAQEMVEDDSQPKVEDLDE